MFLRPIKRKKDGKTHTYWSVVENKRLDNGRSVQRHVLYLSEINSSQAVAFIAFIAYCLFITLGRRLNALAPGLTARSALEKFTAVQMIDVHIPTSDGRELLLSRYTQPEPELQLLIRQLKLNLPPQPPPRIAAAAVLPK